MRHVTSGASVLRDLGRILAEAAHTFARFVVDAGRAIAAHWPQLVALFLAGWAGRMGFLWLATVVSDLSPTIAVLILPLAPMATLLSFVLMLRALAPTLPAFSHIVEPVGARERWTRNLTVAGQVLIPFLAVYASAGLLKQDVTVFLYDTTADESMNTVIQDIDWGRTDYAPGLTVVAFVVVALAARKLISLRGLAERHLAWAGFAAYLEVLWLMTLANALTAQLETITEWVASRRVVAGVVGWGESVIAFVKAWGGWAAAAVDAVSGMLGNLGAVVVVPVAWLAIGAAVYGHQLSSSKIGIDSHEVATTRIQKVPSSVRRVVGHVAEPVVTPVQNTLGAIRKIAVAGILPMVMFCVVFLVAGGVQSAVAALMRVLVGPGPELRQFALEPFVTMVERGVYFVLALALLAAAVNAVVLAQPAPAPGEPQEAAAT
ncbi:MAG TPA: hypothetical protein PKA93_10695 [Arachnia sp.]|nr:hypothetical protein [Arachnia sp.]